MALGHVFLATLDELEEKDTLSNVWMMDSSPRKVLRMGGSVGIYDGRLDRFPIW
jgi:hypothetical protein